MSLESIDEYSPWEASRAAQLSAAVAAARRAASIGRYQAEWGSLGITSNTIDAGSWASIPFLTKDKLVEAAREAPPYGNRLGVPKERVAHAFAAPGPLYMPFTTQDMDRVAGSFAKALASCGLQAGDLVDQTTMYNWVIAATVLDRALEKIGCGIVPGGIGQSDRHLDVIEGLGINAILAFPTFLEHLLEQAAAAGRRLPLRKAAVMGELHDPRTKQRIHDAHGVLVREFYGTADVGAVAWECAAGNGMHLRDDLLVEFVSPGLTQPVEPESGTPVELVVTDLHRQAMPIIRLRTGDLIDGLESAPCSCGRTSPRFKRIVGRAGEITKVKGMFVVPRLVVDVMQKENLERPFRLVVERSKGGIDQLTLEISGAPYADAPAFLAKVEAALRIRLAIQFVPQLPEGAPRLVDRRFQTRAMKP